MDHDSCAAHLALQPIHFRPGTAQQDQAYLVTATTTARLPGWPELTSAPSKPYALYIPPAMCACGPLVPLVMLSDGRQNACLPACLAGGQRC